ncbi:MAG: hypothetical protein RL432_2149 [Bacteroidota bacterium]|jgi:hypothetical protein
MKFLLPALFLALILGTSGCSGSSETENVRENATSDNPQDELPINVQKPSGLHWKKQTFKAENCNIPSTDEMEYMEDWCAQRSVDLLTIELNDKSVAQKINLLITKTITGKASGIQAIKKYVNQVKETNAVDLEENLFQETVTCTVKDSSNNFLCLGIASDYYALGAAHGSFTMNFINFDLTTGNKITLDELIESSNFGALKSLAKRKFLQQNGEEGWWFTTEDQPFELAEVFALERKGLRFIYQQYEIGPYSAGLPEVFLSKEEVKSLLKDNPYWPK